MRVHQVVMLGGGGVGKSALTVQMVHQRVVESYDPTIEDSCASILRLSGHVDRTSVLRIDGEACLIDILDTAGQEQYTSLTDLYIRQGEDFVLVYAVTDHTSFLEVKDLHQQIVRIKDAQSSGVPIVLVGNKIDLENDREVDTGGGEQLARAWRVPFYETSAKRDINVRESFFDVVRECRRFEPAETAGAPTSLFPRKREAEGQPRRRRRGKGRCTIL